MTTPSAGPSSSSSSAPAAQDGASAPQANAAAAAATLSNPHVEAGLNSTAVLHSAMGELYAAGVAAGGAAASVDGEATVQLPLATLKRWRKHAARANKSIAVHAREAFVREDRLSVELAMLRIAARNDTLDRDAHIAQLLDRIRELGEMRRVDALALDASTDAACASASASASASAPASTTSVDIDTAIASVQRVEAALAQLSPIGVHNLHGTPNLAYLNAHPEVAVAADVAAAAAAVEGAPGAALTAGLAEIPGHGHGQAPTASAQ